jgi:CubicO group peptidase (beta-lactamase class C family)
VLAILVDRKVFRWEETILDLFPSIAIRIHPFHHQTTLSMLAAHCAGLTSDIAQVEDGDLWRYLRRVTVSKGQFAVALSYLGRPPDKTPGSSAEWNWANPTLIALAIEIRTSQSLDSFTKTLILDPLEMYSAGFGHPDAKKNASTPEQPTQPWPHQGSTKQIRSPTDVNWFNPPAMGAATGIHCSAPDFARFVDLHLRGSMKLSTQVLPESAAYLYSPYLDTSYTPGNFWINSRDWAGGDALSTSGRCDGFSMAVWLAPLKGKGYFAIANIDGDVGLDITDRAVYLAIRHAAGEY